MKSFFLSLLDSRSYALIDNSSQIFSKLISDFWLFKERSFQSTFVLQPLLQVAPRREVNFTFLVCFLTPHLAKCCRDGRRGLCWPLGYFLTLFLLSGNGREEGREGRNERRYSLIWFGLGLCCWWPH